MPSAPAALLRTARAALVAGPVVALVGVLGVLGVSTLTAPSAAPQPSDPVALRPVSRAHPTNAAAIFGWGRPAWDDQFTEPSGQVRGTWRLTQPHRIHLQHGQLTLNTGTHGDVVATAGDQAATTGRWEARVRSKSFSRAGRPYQVNWELVPARARDQHCGGQSIQLARYKIGAHTAKGAVHTLPDHSFGFGKQLDLGPDVYHTYAVEVTRTRISWFVDTHVIRTERRPAALSGVELRPQFRMAAEPGATMQRSRMQMDWVRYYTLSRANRHPVAAPPMHRGVDHQAC